MPLIETQVQSLPIEIMSHSDPSSGQISFLFKLDQTVYNITLVRYSNQPFILKPLYHSTARPGEPCCLCVNPSTQVCSKLNPHKKQIVQRLIDESNDLRLLWATGLLEVDYDNNEYG